MASGIVEMRQGGGDNGTLWREGGSDVGDLEDLGATAMNTQKSTTLDVVKGLTPSFRLHHPHRTILALHYQL
jgi:hypothetical protein